MKVEEDSEWEVLKSFLPPGTEEAARECGAFQRMRAIKTPWTMLRVALYHANSSGSLKEDATALRQAKLVTFSHVALFKRLQKQGPWLQWIAGQMLRPLQQALAPGGLRLLVADSTCAQGPGSKGTQWRLHYALDLLSAQCHAIELTDASGAELLERVPVQEGTLLLGDRNYFRAEAVRYVRQHSGHVLLRMRWTHPPLEDLAGQRVRALERARTLRNAGAVGDWRVYLRVGEGERIAGRIIAMRLPAPIAARNREKLEKQARKKSKTPSKKSLEAAGFVLLFTTLPRKKYSARRVLRLYRYRWQVECAFKRLKQLLRVGRVPHQEEQAARSWLLAKVVLALLLESLYRKAQTFSPWGFDEQVVQLQSPHPA